MSEICFIKCLLGLMPLFYSAYVRQQCYIKPCGFFHDVKSFTCCMYAHCRVGHEAALAGSEPCVSLLFIRLSLRLAVCLPAWLIGFVLAWITLSVGA